VKERVLPLLQHPLRPLNVCLPSVVAEFKHQVHAAGIASLAGSSVQTVSWVGCVVCRCVSVTLHERVSERVCVYACMCVYV
jgi:hypothetical protein